MNKSSPNPTPSLVQPDMPQVSTAPTNQCPPPPRGSPQGSAGAKVNGTIKVYVAFVKVKSLNTK